MTPAAAQLTFGKYRPIAELGRGGMASVYLAVASGPSGFSKLVVVKALREELGADPEFREMFMDEGRLAARLNHPNIVQTHEILEEHGRFLIVMEYLEGQSLSSVRMRLARGNRFALADKVRVLVDLLDGLHAAHELRDYDGTPLNVVHRDISPHNVFVTYTGEVKVVDFGIAKAATSSTTTRTGVVKGKLSYMAPEQAFGEPVDRRADLFAVGVILWEALAGRRMWREMPDAAIIHALNVGDIPSLESTGQSVGPILSGVVARSLARKPEARYATAAEMRADLQSYLDSRGERPGVREFGKLLETAFADHRTKIQAVIEQQMRLARDVPAFSESALPRLDSLTPQGASQPSQSGHAVTPTFSGSRPVSTVAVPELEPSRGRGWIFAFGAAVVVAAAAIAFAVGSLAHGTSATAAPPSGSGLVPTAPSAPPSAVPVVVAPASAPSSIASAAPAPSAAPVPTVRVTHAPARPTAAPTVTSTAAGLDIQRTR